MGSSPRRSESTFSGRISRTTTRWPSSAKQVAVTRPTQPAPSTPIGSFSLTLRSLRCPVGSLRPRKLPEALSNLQHVFVRNGFDEGVRDPEGPAVGLPGNHPQAVAVVEQFVRAPPDRLFVACTVENRRVLPERGLEDVVVTDRREREDPLVGAALGVGRRLVALAVDLVDAWLLREFAALFEQRRVVDRHLRLPVANPLRERLTVGGADKVGIRAAALLLGGRRGRLGVVRRPRGGDRLLRLRCGTGGPGRPRDAEELIDGF